MTDRDRIPEVLAFYQDAAGTYHYKLKAISGRTLLTGQTLHYLDMTACCPTCSVVRIAQTEPCKPAPRWAAWTWLAIRAVGYDMRVAVNKAQRWELACFELLAWGCVGILTYVAWPI